MTIINPAIMLGSAPRQEGLEALWVDSYLPQLINLALCEEDSRPLRPLFTLPRAMNDSSIAQTVGGLPALTTRKATLGQLAREVNLARRGQLGTFQKKSHYLLFIEGVDGLLVVVVVCWNERRGCWCVSCSFFGRRSNWDQGHKVCGN